MKLSFFIIFLTLITNCGGRVDPIYTVEIKSRNTSSKDLVIEIYYSGAILIKKQINKNDNVIIISELTEGTFLLDGKDSLKVIFSDNKKLVYKPKNYYKDFKDERSPLNPNVYELKKVKNNYSYQYTFDEKDYLMAK